MNVKKLLGKKNKTQKTSNNQNILKQNTITQKNFINFKKANEFHKILKNTKNPKI